MADRPSPEEIILYEKDPKTKIATITFNRPEVYNAFRAQTVEELDDDYPPADRELDARVLVAFGDRVSPGRMVERRKHAIGQSVGRARDAVMGVKDSAAGSAGRAPSRHPAVPVDGSPQSRARRLFAIPSASSP